MDTSLLALVRSQRLLAVALLACARLAFAGPTDELSPTYFQDEVAPVLARRCLSCHGPDRQEGDFSVETAATAMASGYVEPGDPEASHLLAVVTPTDGQARMPQSGGPLDEREIAALRRWIAGGAPWPTDFVVQHNHLNDFGWWSYQPLRRPPIPLADDPWVRTPIDGFVLAKLRNQGLQPSPEADRRTLIRRLTYDLTGLPPTPEEVQAFVADSDPQAYERLVEQLLASPHYGERWARHWLDVAKYADTCGYDKDKLRRHAWPYRDYVIRAFNDDKPYGRFVREQLAGDVLYPGEPDGIVALGFIAAGPWDFIGHVEVAEDKIDGKIARSLDRDDMVAGAINAFCSLTVQCARCHHHKFDPIAQEHYYGLQAIFAAVDRADRPYDADPAVASERARLTAQRTAVVSEADELLARRTAAAGPRLGELDQQIASLRARQQVSTEPQFGYHSAISADPLDAKWVEVDLGRATVARRVVVRPCHDDFAGIGAGFGFPVRFRVEAFGDDGTGAVLYDATADEATNPGLDPLSLDLGAAPVRRVRVTATQLAARQGDYIFALAEIEVLDAAGANLARDAEVRSLDSIEASPRWGRRNLVDGKWPSAADPAAPAALAEAERQRETLLAQSESAADAARRRELQQRLAEIDGALAGLPAPQTVYAAATHFAPQGAFQPTRGVPRAVHVLSRGDVQRPGPAALPGVLPLAADDAWQLPADASESERRAALARWLTRPDHPLTWRSIVNRIWQYHFGRGVVETPNDFGRMGAEPTHPELLDWLASEFQARGESFKELHRLLVLSSVYRQGSADVPEYAALDGENRWLWRMPRRRLDAEEIRDSLLAASGLLDARMGGPGYFLFKLEKEEHSPHYEYDLCDLADPATHRRSVYRFVVRSQPHPWMTTLDCADSSQSTPRRNETLTALQALALLNNRFNLLAAERMAARLAGERADLADQVERAVELALQRAPTAEERNELTAFAAEYGLPSLARCLFNLSEFVYVD